MKTYAKLGLALLFFGFVLSVLGAIVIRSSAPAITQHAESRQANQVVLTPSASQPEVSSTSASAASAAAPQK